MMQTDGGRPLWWVAITRFVKYGLTGVINTVVSYLVYALLVFFHLEVHWSMAVGYAFGMGTSYVINSIWTFRHRLAWRVALKFLVVNAVVLLLSETTLTLILRHITSSPYLAQGLNVIPIVLFGFAMNQLLVFRRRREGQGERA